MEKQYSFNVFNEFAGDGIGNALLDCINNEEKPIIICIGSDLVLGDSLGPLVGTFLKQKHLNAYLYGTLNTPITAKEISYAQTHLKEMHPLSKIIAIDAAVGCETDLGLIKIFNKGLKPGLGVNKSLGTIGDVSIMGIVATKSIQNYNLYNLTRLNLVYKMAERIASGIEQYINYAFYDNNKNLNRGA